MHSITWMLWKQALTGHGSHIPCWAGFAAAVSRFLQEYRTPAVLSWGVRRSHGCSAYGKKGKGKG